MAELRVKNGRYDWIRSNFDGGEAVSGENVFKVEMPLLGRNFQNFGSLRLIKDAGRHPMDHHTLKRVEYLRRTITGVLEKLAAGP